MANQIRKLTVTDAVNQMNYVIDSLYNVRIGGEIVKAKCTSIELESDDQGPYFMVYLSVKENESFPWKQQPKNQWTSVEYFID